MTEGQPMVVIERMATCRTYLADSPAARPRRVCE